MLTDSSALHARWTNAVESYRRSVDLYRRVIELRARARRVEPLAMLAVRAPHANAAVEPEAAVPRLGPLTAREREVACLIARGFTNAQIASRLVVTRGTVANHVAHILVKLNLSNRTQVAAHVTREQGSDFMQQAAG